MRIFPNRVEPTSGQSGKWHLWRWCDIVMDGVPYLTRLELLRTPWFSIKLHWILRPDPDRGLHDHPWRFIALMLRGGYTELVARDPENDQPYERRIRWFNCKNAVESHRINTVRPNTLTLVVAGRNHKSWGFYIPQGDGTAKFVDWKAYEFTT